MCVCYVCVLFLRQSIDHFKEEQIKVFSVAFPINSTQFDCSKKLHLSNDNLLMQLIVYIGKCPLMIFWVT